MKNPIPQPTQIRVYDSGSQALFDVVSVALACMMIVIIMGSFIPNKIQKVPCKHTLTDKVGIIHEFHVQCEVSKDMF